MDMNSDAKSFQSQAHAYSLKLEKTSRYYIGYRILYVQTLDVCMQLQGKSGIYRSILQESMNFPIFFMETHGKKELRKQITPLRSYC